MDIVSKNINFKCLSLHYILNITVSVENFDIYTRNYFKTNTLTLCIICTKINITSNLIRMVENNIQ